MARQISIDLPRRDRRGLEDFFVSTANSAAHRMVTGHAAWPDGKLALIGPEGCGKSHLVAIWAEDAGAEVYAAKALPTTLPPPGARVAVEDVDTLPEASEEALFHLHNHLINSGGMLLVTGRSAPSRWTTRLRDLRSRLEATTVIPISDPDDALLAALMAKLFANRQLVPARDVIPYLVLRLPRSYAAAAEMVDRLDRAALEEGCGVTRKLAARLLDKAPE
jgi:chromosomal replication initiation ATPase DnaA